MSQNASLLTCRLFCIFWTIIITLKNINILIFTSIPTVEILLKIVKNIYNFLYQISLTIKFIKNINDQYFENLHFFGYFLYW